MNYRPTSWEALAEHLQHRERGPLLSHQDKEARISLAGAQDKLLLMVLEDGSPAIPEGSAPSSHILKPNIQGLRGVWATAINETFCMQLAAELGLEVAERMPAAIESTLATLGPEAHQGTEQTLLERLHNRLWSNCKKMPERWSVGQG